MAPIQSETDWMYAPVVARAGRGWVHGQVVGVQGSKLVVCHGSDQEVTCARSTARKIDPIVALLLGTCQLPTATNSIQDVRAIHGEVLARLLGDQRQKPTRNVEVILANLVDDFTVPSGLATCVWVDASRGTSHRFPLQHAVDYVFVSESGAKRIPKAVRNGIGATFFLPPA